MPGNATVIKSLIGSVDSKIRCFQNVFKMYTLKAKNNACVFQMPDVYNLKPNWK